MDVAEQRIEKGQLLFKLAIAMRPHLIHSTIKKKAMEMGVASHSVNKHSLFVVDSTLLFLSPYSPAPHTGECAASCERSEELADTG